MTKELLLLCLYLALLAYLLASKRIVLLRYAVLAFAIGLAWTMLVGDEYGYNTATVSLVGVNLYALLGWSLGLLLGYILYASAQRYIGWTKWWQKLMLFNMIYLPLLIVAETVAYHSFNVVNVATASYSGLPICDCIHAPLWMQIAYLAMGSIYFMLTRLVKRYNLTTILARVQAAG